RQHAVHRIGAARSRVNDLVDLDENLVVDVDFAVHIRRVRPLDRYLHAGVMRVGQHRVGLKSVAGHGAQLRHVGLVVGRDKGGGATGSNAVDARDVGDVVQ